MIVINIMVNRVPVFHLFGVPTRTVHSPVVSAVSEPATVGTCALRKRSGSDEVGGSICWIHGSGLEPDVNAPEWDVGLSSLVCGDVLTRCWGQH